MRVIRGGANAKGAQRPSVVTIGNFDGVHRGHQALIARARSHATAAGLPLSVLTFEPTPREFFAAETAPPRVTNLRSKLADLADVGVDQVMVQRFDAAFSRYPPDEFVGDLLLRDLGARVVVVGDDFRYGQARAGDYSQLCAAGQRHGFLVDTIDTVALAGKRCSSTQLRAALAQGALVEAAEMLGRPFSLLGRVRPGRRLGRTLDMPTANFPLHRRLALRLGVFAVEVRLAGIWRPAIANHGVRPTLGGTPALLEVHCFESPGDLYGQELRVRFRHFLRDEARFPSLDALKTQMQHDKRAAEEWFAYTALPIPT